MRRKSADKASRQSSPWPERSAAKPTAPTGPRIPARRRFFFIVASLAVIAILQESLFRYAFPLPEVEGFNRITYTKTYAFGSAFAANSKQGLSNVRILWQSEPDGFSFEHRLNLYGFRGPDFSIDPPADKPRIVFIGDSFVEGCGVAEDDTIPQQFARIARPVDAINLGVAGSNFLQYGLVLRDAVPLLRPTAVFVIACHNDLPVSPSEPVTEEMLAAAVEFPRIKPYVPRIAQLLDRLGCGLVLPRRAYSGPFPFFEPAPAPSNPLTRHMHDPPPERFDPGIYEAMKRGKANPFNIGLGNHCERVLRHDFQAEGQGAGEFLEHFLQCCRQNNCRLILAYIPHPCTANPLYIPVWNKFGIPGFGNLKSVDQPPYRNQQEHLRAVCDRLGIPFLDMTDEFIEVEKSGQRLYWPYDTHCNAAGYHLAAEICAHFWSTGAMPRSKGGIPKAE